MSNHDHAAALADAKASREQAEADLAAVRARNVEVMAVVERLRELQPRIPAIIAALFNKEK